MDEELDCPYLCGDSSGDDDDDDFDWATSHRLRVRSKAAANLCKAPVRHLAPELLPPTSQARLPPFCAGPKLQS